MPLWSTGLTADSLEFEFENGSVTGSDLDFGIHDNVLLDSSDGAPGTDADFRLALEEQSEKKPQWLTEDQKARCFANNDGWWLRHEKGSGDRYWDELLVQVTNLRGANSTTGLGIATITNISFEGLTSGAANNAPAYEVGGSGTLANAFVQVVWNEAVDYTLSTLPTLVVTHTATSDSSETSYTATAAVGNTTVNVMEAYGTDWDTILLNSTDGAPESNAGEKIILEDASESDDGDMTFLQMEKQTTGTAMNFYFTIAGSDGAGTLSVARQSITLNSSTFKEAGDTETADSGIMQQVSAAMSNAAVTIS